MTVVSAKAVDFIAILTSCRIRSRPQPVDTRSGKFAGDCGTGVAHVIGLSRLEQNLIDDVAPASRQPELELAPAGLDRHIFLDPCRIAR
jgi:hypothetical protein